MADPTTQAPATADFDSDLSALIEAGGFWRLAPEWVPRWGYVPPTPDVLRGVEAGLRGLIA